MKRSIGRTIQVLGVASIAAILCATTPAQGVSAGFSAGAGSASFQVLTSGPLHESFARPVIFGGNDAYYVPATPPASFEEVLPLQRPAGFSEWVPGYWSFEDQQQTWIWVSGTWRVPPPGYTWVPGYWSQSTRGWRYVAGYWAPAASVDTEVDYLPAPPEPIDVGAVGTAPYSDAIWAPGNWMWSGSNYNWRRGYFVRARPDWVWTPANYTWTPNGYVFQDGYWDHSLTRRGLLYAPVAFNPGSSTAAGFSFTPSSVINVGLFSDSLFVRPASDQYYFGDYYATSWWDRGVYPAYAFHMTRYGYDPLFAYASWYGSRGDPRWLDARRAGFLNLQAHPEARPQPAAVAVAANDVVTARITPLKIETVPESDRQKLVARAKEGQLARTERIKLETPAGAAAELTQARKVRISKDLLPGAAESGKATVALPDRPEIPKVETGRQPEAVKGDARRLGEPSIDRPVDHVGQAGGKAEPAKRADAVPPVVKPDPVKVAPQPPGRPDVVRPVPTPNGGKPAPQPPRPEPAKRPEAQPPMPKPEGKNPQPTPAPKPDGGKPAPSPSPKPGGKPDGKPKLDAPDSRPDGSGSLMS